MNEREGHGTRVEEDQPAGVRDGYPAGVPCWVDTAQDDPEAAAAFYRGLFGWEFEDVMPVGSPDRYLVGRLRGLAVAAVGSRPANGSGPAAWNTYVAVESADDTAAKVRAAGGTVLMDPFDIRDSGRMAVFADPSGASFSVWQARRFRGAQLVNAPGSWVFSELNTPDPYGAEAFYGAVLGWQASDLGGGDGGELAMWRLAGYGDYLAARDPGLRERQADDSVPEGFADAVAWLVPTTGDRLGDGVPPHWSITFGVDDADATAARAEELGGRVVVAPFDAPYVRMTVLGDPQGATFTASRYTPASGG